MHAVGRNFYCKKQEPFENLPVCKTIFDKNRLGFDFFVKRESNGLCPVYYILITIFIITIKYYYQGATLLSVFKMYNK